MYIHICVHSFIYVYIHMISNMYIYIYVYIALYIHHIQDTSPNEPEPSLLSPWESLKGLGPGPFKGPPGPF